MIHYKCCLCGRPLPEIEPHERSFTACDECYDMCGTAEVLIDRIRMKEEITEAAWCCWKEAKCEEN